MPFVFLFVTLITVTQVDYFDRVRKGQDAGATWHFVNGQPSDPKAKQFFGAKTIYWKLKHKEKL